jgi:hypothetical protein
MPPGLTADQARIRIEPTTAEPVLSESEIPHFLEWLFSDSASKPKALTLRETAAVVRYLRRLSTQGIPKSILKAGPEAIAKYRQQDELKERESRLAVDLIAKIVWGDLLQFGRIQAASNKEAQQFFKARVGFWKHPKLDQALKFLEQFDLPADAQDPFQPPALVGGRHAVYGSSNSYLQDDLSERIATADYTLKQAGVKSRRQCIADALGKSPAAKEGGWLDEEIADRAKAYRRSKSARPGFWLARRWISSFRFRWNSPIS